MIGANRIGRCIAERRVALGCGALSLSTNVIEIIGMSGLDFVWLDLEHGGMSPYDCASMDHLVRAAEIHGMATMAKIPANDVNMIGKVLCSGVNAVLVPGVITKEDVEKAVKSVKFFVPGASTLRGAPYARVTGWSAPDREFGERSDREVMVGIVLEHRTAIDNIQDLLNIKGLDFAFVGPSDLSISLGSYFQTRDPAVQEYISKALTFCKSRGFPLGTAVADAEEAQEAIRKGFALIRLGQDLSILKKQLVQMIQKLRPS